MADPIIPGEISEADLMALLLRAGVRPEEIHADPDLGLLISAAGLRKLAQVSPHAARAMQAAEELVRLTRLATEPVAGRA